MTPPAPSSSGTATIARLHVHAPRWGGSVSEAVRDLPHVGVIVHADAESVLEATRSDPTGIAMIENTGSYDLTEFLIRVKETAPKMPGIVIAENVPVLAVKHILSMPRWDMLDAPVVPAALEETIAKVSRQEQATTDPSAGKCWTVTSSVGGAGATLIAVEIAYQISQREERNKVCLVDLNFFDGACASYLNCPPNLNQSALTQAADRIDEALLQAFITPHKNGIHLLSAPRSSKLWHTIKPEAILKVLDIVCSAYDHVIIDLPRWPMPWTGAVVTGSDENIVMSELTVPALHAARHRADELEEFSDGIARPRIVLNRMAKKMFSNTVTVSQAEDAIGRPVFATVSSDWDAALTAVNFGQAVSQARPGNRITKDVAAMIETLEAGGEATVQTLKARKSA